MAALVFVCLCAVAAFGPATQQAQAATSLKSDGFYVMLSEKTFLFDGRIHKPVVNVIERYPLLAAGESAAAEVDSAVDSAVETAAQLSNVAEPEADNPDTTVNEEVLTALELVNAPLRDLGLDQVDVGIRYEGNVYHYLDEGEDYAVKYKRGVLPGVAKAVVKGVGDYSGKVAQRYRVKSRVKFVNQFKIGFPYGCEMVSCRQLLKSQGIDASKFFDSVAKNYPVYYSRARWSGVIGNAVDTANFANTYLKSIGKSKKLRLVADKGCKVKTLIADANAGYPSLAIISDPAYAEHCVAIVGGTKKHVAIMDPIRGFLVKPIKEFRAMYKAWGSQSVRIKH